MSEQRTEYYAFLIKRARDSEAWPTIFSDRKRAEEYPDRVSPVVPVSFPPAGDA